MFMIKYAEVNDICNDFERASVKTFMDRLRLFPSIIILTKVPKVPQRIPATMPSRKSSPGF